MIIKVMKSIDLKMVLASLGFIGLGVATVFGLVQQVIGFADPLNEMVFALLAMMMGIGFMFNIKK